MKGTRCYIFRKGQVFAMSNAKHCLFYFLNIEKEDIHLPYESGKDFKNAQRYERRKWKIVLESAPFKIMHLKPVAMPVPETGFHCK